MKRISQIEEFGRIHREALRRDWGEARQKVEEEGRCRVHLCPMTDLQAAHIIGRTHDRKRPLMDETWPLGDVHPNRIVPLCQGHHAEYDAHALDLLPYLTLHEVLQAVADSATGRENGLEKARIRLTGSR